MQFTAFWCIERDRRGWRSSVAIAEKIITFLMDKKSITKHEVKVRSRIRSAATPSSLAHRSWKLIHSLQTYKGTQWNKLKLFRKTSKKIVSMWATAPIKHFCYLLGILECPNIWKSSAYCLTSFIIFDYLSPKRWWNSILKMFVGKVCSM